MVSTVCLEGEIDLQSAFFSDEVSLAGMHKYAKNRYWSSHNPQLTYGASIQ
jgi:hypothetical protein